MFESEIEQAKQEIIQHIEEKNEKLSEKKKIPLPASFIVIVRPSGYVVLTIEGYHKMTTAARNKMLTLWQG